MEHAHSPQIVAHCPLCRSAYEPSEIHLLGEKGTTRLFHCTCKSCGHAVLAIVLDNGGAVSSVGLVTDLEIQDAVRFQGALAVSADDCVAVHELVERQSKALCERLLDKKL